MEMRFSVNEKDITREEAERVLGKKRFKQSIEATVRAYREEGKPFSMFLVGNDIITIFIFDHTTCGLS